MSDTNDSTKKPGGRTPLTLKKVETSTVKQSFSHGRTKAVVVEKKRTLGPAPAALARGDLDSLTYLTLLQTVIGKRADLEDRELAARMAEIQLEAALFIPPPATVAAP